MEDSLESTPRLVIDSEPRSKEDDVMELSITVREDDVKEEVPEVVGEQMNVRKMVETVKKSFSERRERIKRLRTEKEIKAVYLAKLKSEEAEDMKRLEEIERVKMEIEHKKQEIRSKVKERDIVILNTKQALKERARQQARQEVELKKEMDAVKELV